MLVLLAGAFGSGDAATATTTWPAGD